MKWIKRLMVWRTVRELQRDNAKLQTRNAELERERIVRRPVEDLTEEELRAAFDVSDEQPLYQAVLQVIDERILQAVEAVSAAPSERLTAEARTHAAGGLDELRELQTELIRRRQRAKQAQPVPGNAAEAQD